MTMSPNLPSLSRKGASRAYVYEAGNMNTPYATVFDSDTAQAELEEILSDIEPPYILKYISADNVTVYERKVGAKDPLKKEREPLLEANRALMGTVTALCSELRHQASGTSELVKSQAEIARGLLESHSLMVSAMKLNLAVSAELSQEDSTPKLDPATEKVLDMIAPHAGDMLSAVFMAVGPLLGKLADMLPAKDEPKALIEPPKKKTRKAKKPAETEGLS